MHKKVSLRQGFRAIFSFILLESLLITGLIILFPGSGIKPCVCLGLEGDNTSTSGR